MQRPIHCFFIANPACLKQGFDLSADHATEPARANLDARLPTTKMQMVIWMCIDFFFFFLFIVDVQTAMWAANDCVQENLSVHY